MTGYFYVRPPEEGQREGYPSCWHVDGECHRVTNEGEFLTSTAAMGRPWDTIILATLTEPAGGKKRWEGMKGRFVPPS